MFMGVFQKKDLVKSIASQTLSMQNYYIVFIRTLYYHLLEYFLVRIIIIGLYKRTMIRSTHPKKLSIGRPNIKSGLFLL